eukprot:4851472-Pyramimonas_sp.AAC.1
MRVCLASRRHRQAGAGAHSSAARPSRPRLLGGGAAQDGGQLPRVQALAGGAGRPQQAPPRRAHRLRLSRDGE